MLRERGSKLGTYISVDYKFVCTEHFLRHPLKIGSPGKVVDIDEKLLTRKKYNRGRVKEKQWFPGNIERGTNKCFVFAVER